MKPFAILALTLTMTVSGCAGDDHRDAQQSHAQHLISSSRVCEIVRIGPGYKVSDAQRAEIEQLAREHGRRASQADENVYNYEAAALEVYANACRLRRAGYPDLAEKYLRTALQASRQSETNGL